MKLKYGIIQKEIAFTKWSQQTVLSALIGRSLVLLDLHKRERNLKANKAIAKQTCRYHKMTISSNTTTLAVASNKHNGCALTGP